MASINTSRGPNASSSALFNGLGTPKSAHRPSSDSANTALIQPAPQAAPTSPSTSNSAPADRAVAPATQSNANESSWFRREVGGRLGNTLVALGWLALAGSVAAMRKTSAGLERLRQEAHSRALFPLQDWTSAELDAYHSRQMAEGNSTNPRTMELRDLGGYLVRRVAADSARRAVAGSYRARDIGRDFRKATATAPADLRHMARRYVGAAKPRP